MDIISLSYTNLRFKTAEKIKNYLALSKNNRLTVGLYKKGKFYVLGDPKKETRFLYDIGSISKTATAHLILKLCENKVLDIDSTVDKYLPLKKGKYPTLYQLLTHTAGYHHLTPIELTLPQLIIGGYAAKNPYENCTVKNVIKCLERRRFFKPRTQYGYSDFAFAILAAIAEAVTKVSFGTLFEQFVQNDLGLLNTTVKSDRQHRSPPATKGNRILPFWIWKENNPYIAGGGMISNIEDMLRYIALQIESDKSYITSAHALCENSALKNNNHLMCIGWHTYKHSNQLWHVGGVGTFRTSIIVNKKLQLGVAVLGNAKGRACANAHYIAKMLYSELKNKRIHLT